MMHDLIDATRARLSQFLLALETSVVLPAPFVAATPSCLGAAAGTVLSIACVQEVPAVLRASPGPMLL